MYVLIAVFITTSAQGIGAYKGVAFQEFESRSSCESAKKITEKMMLEVRGYSGSDAFRLTCERK